MQPLLTQVLVFMLNVLKLLSSKSCRVLNYLSAQFVPLFYYKARKEWWARSMTQHEFYPCSEISTTKCITPLLFTSASFKFSGHRKNTVRFITRIIHKLPLAYLSIQSLFSDFHDSHGLHCSQFSYLLRS